MRNVFIRGLSALLAVLLCVSMSGLTALAEEATTAAIEGPGEEATTAAIEGPGEEATTAPIGETDVEETTAQPEKPVVTFAPGDVSGDGTVDAEDARITLRIAVGIESYAENAPQTVAADLDGIPGVSAADARLVLRVAVSLTTLVEGPDHVHVFEKEVVAPTCTEEGYTLTKCLLCDESTKDDFTPPAHHYYRFYCTLCGQMDPLHVKTPFANSFEQILYDRSHPLFYKTADELTNTPGVGSGSILEMVYHRIGKWCCYYTIHDVFRPVLQKAGYSAEQIDHLAPIYYESDKIDKVIRNSISSKNFYVPVGYMGTIVPMYVPSMLLDYYLEHPQYAKTYIFAEYYDDMVEQRLYQPDADRADYQPRVGDILFMSNKTSTYVNGYPTVDHTAQIIMMYDDGSFWCTEGSIIQTNDPEQDNKPRARERRYYLDPKTGVYQYIYMPEGGTAYTVNPVIQVLAVAQPDIYGDLNK